MVSPEESVELEQAAQPEEAAEAEEAAELEDLRRKLITVQQVLRGLGPCDAISEWLHAQTVLLANELEAINRGA